jgi:hypothetical protein
MPQNMKKKPLGVASTGRKILGILIALGIVFAFFQVPATPNAVSIVDSVTSRADTLSAWVKQVGAGLERGALDLGFKVNEPEALQVDFTLPELDPSSPEFAPEKVAEVAATINTNNFNPDAPYNRGDWYHWSNYERSCWTVREEVLYRDAVKDESLTILDSNKVRTSDKNEACYITGGTWIDPFTGEEFYNPEDLDIDHVIALGYANSGGGSEWDGDRKQDFANNLNYSKHLLAVSASANRSKSDKGPADWMPKNEEFHCEYVTIWTTIANNWGLNLNRSDKNKIVDVLEKCS